MKSPHKGQTVAFWGMFLPKISKIE